VKNLKTYEGFFDFFRKKSEENKSEEDKIVDMYISRLKKVKDISPYKITLSTTSTVEGEQYWSKYKVEFEDVSFRIVKCVAARRFPGWSDEFQKGSLDLGAVKKNNYTFYYLVTYPMGDEVVVTPTLKKIEELFELVEKVYKKDQNARKIKKITDEINPAADLIDDNSISESLSIEEQIYEGFFESVKECFQEFEDKGWYWRKRPISGEYCSFASIPNFTYIMKQRENDYPYESSNKFQFTGQIDSNGEITFENEELYGDKNWTDDINEDYEDFKVAVKRLQSETGLDFNFSFNNLGGDYRIVISGSI
jgi:hypothetical protein